MSHEMKIGKYVSKYGDPRDRHTCKICQRAVVHDVEIMAKHFTTIHSGDISLHQYFIKYVKPDMDQSLFVHKAQDTESKNSDSSSEDISEEVLSLFKAWCDRNTYECKVCHKADFKIWNGLRLHVVALHSINTQNYIAKYGDPRGDFHRCRICGTKVIFDVGNLTEHFARKHHAEVSLLQYFVTYINGNVSDEQESTTSTKQMELEPNHIRVRSDLHKQESTTSTKQMELESNHLRVRSDLHEQVSEISTENMETKLNHVNLPEEDSKISVSQMEPESDDSSIPTNSNDSGFTKRRKSERIRSSKSS